MPEDALLRSLARRDTGFVYLAHDVPAARAERVQAMNIEGLEFIPKYRRVYPRTWMASQLLGQVGTDGNGLAGLEYSQDEHLHGSDGQRQMVKDALGDPIRMHDVKPTIPGEDVRLTLDSDLQTRAEDVLAEVGQTYQPKGATAIVMDPQLRGDQGAGQLAAGRRQQPRIGAVLRAPGPRDRRDLRAGLDLQGVHRGRRAAGGQGHAGHLLQPRRRRSRSPTGRSARPRRAATRR